MDSNVVVYPFINNLCKNSSSILPYRDRPLLCLLCYDKPQSSVSRAVESCLPTDSMLSTSFMVAIVTGECHVISDWKIFHIRVLPYHHPPTFIQCHVHYVHTWHRMKRIHSFYKIFFFIRSTKIQVEQALDNDRTIYCNYLPVKSAIFRMIITIKAITSLSSARSKNVTFTMHAHLKYCSYI